MEGMMLKLKLQYFGHLMQRVDSLEKTLLLGGIGGRRKSGNSVRLLFWGALKSLLMVIAAIKLKDAYSLEGKL